MGIESGGTFDLWWLAENTKQAVCCRSALTGNKVDNFKVTILPSVTPPTNLIRNK